MNNWLTRCETVCCVAGNIMTFQSCRIQLAHLLRDFERLLEWITNKKEREKRLILTTYCEGDFVTSSVGVGIDTGMWTAPSGTFWWPWHPRFGCREITIIRMPSQAARECFVISTFNPFRHPSREDWGEKTVLPDFARYAAYKSKVQYYCFVKHPPCFLW